MNLIAPLLAAEVNIAEFLERISGFLGGYYVVLALMNAVMALFLTLPYGKFAHGVFRGAALLKWAIEKRSARTVKLSDD